MFQANNPLRKITILPPWWTLSAIWTGMGRDLVDLPQEGSGGSPARVQPTKILSCIANTLRVIADARSSASQRAVRGPHSSHERPFRKRLRQRASFLPRSAIPHKSRKQRYLCIEYQHPTRTGSPSAAPLSATKRARLSLDLRRVSAGRRGLWPVKSVYELAVDPRASKKPGAVRGKGGSLSRNHAGTGLAGLAPPNRAGRPSKTASSSAGTCKIHLR